MWKKLAAPRSLRNRLIMILTAAVITSTAYAGEFAELGVVHPEGRIELDLARFTSTIRNGPGSSVLVAQTLLKVSNGFLSVLRIGDDECTTEELPLYSVVDHDETFVGVPASAEDGVYDVDSDSLKTPPSMSAHVVVVSLAELMSCLDVACEGEDSACFRHISSGQAECVCETWKVIDGVLTRVGVSDGCLTGLFFRPWWTLADSVDASYVQSL